MQHGLSGRKFDRLFRPPPILIPSRMGYIEFGWLLSLVVGYSLFRRFILYMYIMVVFWKWFWYRASQIFEEGVRSLTSYTWNLLGWEICVPKLFYLAYLNICFWVLSTFRWDTPRICELVYLLKFYSIYGTPSISRITTCRRGR